MRHLLHPPLLSGIKLEVTAKVSHQIVEGFQGPFNLLKRLVESAADLEQPNQFCQSRVFLQVWYKPLEIPVNNAAKILVLQVGTRSGDASRIASNPN